MKPVDESKVAELALLASRLDPKQIAEANARMEAEMVEKMKTMTKEERMKVLAMQKVLTMRTVEALKGMSNNPEAFNAGLSLDTLKQRVDPSTRSDDDLLHAIRGHTFEAFTEAFTEQKRSPFAALRFVTDKEGHPMLHWAALENNMDVLVFLFAGTPPSEHHRLADQRNVRGETALAWACMKGHTQIIHELLRRGADIHAACNKGFTAMHIAAQNGRVFTLAQLARRGLHVDVRDNDGHTPLHWAAYKGYVEATRWLLAHGADPAALDWQNCTPLHWASLKAHVPVMAALIETGASGPLLKAKDNTGGTPQSLAEDKARKIAEDLEANPELENEPGKNAFSRLQYDKVVWYCKARQKVEDAVEANGGKPTLMMRISAKMPHWSYFMWPILAPIGYWQYVTAIWPVTAHHLILHFVFNVCFWAKWVFWARLQVRDPGEFVEPFGPPGTTLGTGPSLPSWGWRRGGYPDFSLYSKSAHDGDTRDRTQDVEAEAQRLVRSSDVRATRVTSNPAMAEWAAKHRALYDRVLDEGLAVPVCLTCEIVKPVRAKHDKVSDVCVAKFDHFCPWMNSCVGELNYADFFFTAVSATIAMFTWLVLVVYFTWEVNPDGTWWGNFANMWRWELFAWMYSLMALYGLAMTAQHIHLAAKNLSTNEMINGYRYRYMVEDGRRGNPFDRGVLSNFAEMIGLLRPLQMDPEAYYSAELAGEPLRPVPSAMPGSPWYHKPNAHGGHSHAGGGDHGHSHAGGEDHGHSHSSGNSHGHSH